jgi:aerobic-type carbon monoxide dehydrogenase small subunit (CoxS/CutS family)
MLSVEVGNDLGLDPSTPLLQVVRNCLGVTGTKYACGIAKRDASNIVLDENPCL